MIRGLILTLAAASLRVWAQEPVEMATRSGPAVFRGTTNEVQVPVIVRDSHGRAVTGLRVEDFRLFDRAKPQTITRLSIRQANGSATATPSRFLIYLFDNTLATPQLREAATRYVNAHLGPADRVAVFATQEGLILDFTDDRVKLTETLQRIPVARPAPAGRSLEMRGQVLEQLGRQSLNAIRDAVRRISLMPGERTVAVLSCGFLINDLVIQPDSGPDRRIPVHLSEEVHDLIQQAIRSRVVINCLDPQGLPPKVDLYGVIYATRAVLSDLSSGTGGVLFKDSNDLDLGLLKTAGAPEYAYILSFAPQNLRYDGSYHTVRVTVPNTRNADVQARPGYFAPRRLDDPVETAKEEIREAMLSREEIDQLPADVHTAFTRMTSGKARIAIQVHVDLKTLQFRHSDGRSCADLAVVVGLFDRNGIYVDGGRTDVKLQLKEEHLAQWMRTGIRVPSNLDAPPGSYLVRVVVRDSDGTALAAHNAAVEMQ